jgi:hypothetical protein
VFATKAKYILTPSSTPFMQPRTAEYQLQVSHPEMSRDSQLLSTQLSRKECYRGAVIG